MPCEASWHNPQGFGFTRLYLFKAIYPYQLSELPGHWFEYVAGQVFFLFYHAGFIKLSLWRFLPFGSGPPDNFSLAMMLADSQSA